jgi:hypothetical protein
MRQGKLFDLFRALQPGEWERFELFLASPYFNTDSRLLTLFHHYRDFAPDFPEPQTGKEAVFRLIWGSEVSFREKQVRDLDAALSQQLQQFFRQQELRERQQIQELLMAQALASRSLPIYLERVVDRYPLPSSFREPIDGWFQYQTQYLLLRELTEGVQKSFERIRTSGEGLDRAFRLAKLRLAAELKSSRAYASQGESLWMMEPLLQWCRGNQEALLPLEKLYVDFLTLLEKGYEFESYDRFRKAFEADLPQQSHLDREVLWQGLLNFVGQLINEEGAALLRESWSLYRLGLEYGIPIHRGRLSDTIFSNIVVNAASLQEFSWAENFIEAYADYLDPAVKENALALSWAYWFYHKAAYDEALDQLRDVSYVSVGYAVRGRSLQLRNYYEAARLRGHCQPELYSHIEAFRRYVQRSKRLSDQYKGAYLKYIGFTRRLARTLDNPNFSEARLNRLAEEIRQAEEVIAREWLMKKVAEFFA